MLADDISARTGLFCAPIVKYEAINNAIKQNFLIIHFNLYTESICSYKNTEPMAYSIIRDIYKTAIIVVI